MVHKGPSSRLMVVFVRGSESVEMISLYLYIAEGMRKSSSCEVERQNGNTLNVRIVKNYLSVFLFTSLPSPSPSSCLSLLFSYFSTSSFCFHFFETSNSVRRDFFLDLML